MDYDDSNEIEKKFKCEQCSNFVNILIFKNTHKRVGYLCENCWRLFRKRMIEIYKL